MKELDTSEMELVSGGTPNDPGQPDPDLPMTIPLSSNSSSSYGLSSLFGGVTIGRVIEGNLVSTRSRRGSW